MTKQEMIDRYNEFGAQRREQALDDSSPHAEYVQSFGYGEAYIPDLINSADLEDTTKNALRSFFKENGTQKTLNLLEQHGDVITAGINIRSGEIYSCEVGEIEEQPDDDLRTAFLALSIEDRKEVARQVDEYLQTEGSCAGNIYINLSHNRFVMVVDEDELRSSLNINEEV